jgi:hypothetical protein
MTVEPTSGSSEGGSGASEGDGWGELLIALGIWIFGVVVDLFGTGKKKEALESQTAFLKKMATTQADIYGDESTLATQRSKQATLAATFAQTQADFALTEAGFARKKAKEEARGYRTKALGVAGKGADYLGLIAARAGASGLGGGSVGRQQQRVQRETRSAIGGLKAGARLSEETGELAREGFLQERAGYLVQKSDLELKAEGYTMEAGHLKDKQALAVDEQGYLDEQLELGIDALWLDFAATSIYSGAKIAMAGVS